MCVQRSVTCWFYPERNSSDVCGIQKESREHKAAHQQVLEAGRLERKPHSNLLTSAEGDSEAKKRQKEASHCRCSLSNTHACTHAHTLVSQRLKDRATVIQYSPDPGLYKGLTFYTDKGLSSGLRCVALLLQEIMHVCVCLVCYKNTNPDLHSYTQIRSFVKVIKVITLHTSVEK